MLLGIGLDLYSRDLTESHETWVYNLGYDRALLVRCSSCSHFLQISLLMLFLYYEKTSVSSKVSYLYRTHLKSKLQIARTSVIFSVAAQLFFFNSDSL